jgi:hypothetical protein
VTRTIHHEVTPVALYEIVAGYWAAKTLNAAIELEVFTDLFGTDGTTAEEFAARHGIELRPAEILLTACAGLGLLLRYGDRYRNTRLANEFLVRGRPYYFGGYVELMNRRNYPGWLRVMEAIRENRPMTWNSGGDAEMFAQETVDRGATFWEGMHAISRYTAAALDDAVDLMATGRLLDVGGGGGAFVVELCQRHPRLRATVFDLPHVCTATMDVVGAAGLSGRVNAVPGDFFQEPLPTGHDTILLSSILRDWSEPDNRAILHRCFDALPAGGRILICELLVDDDKDGPRNAALMGMVMLVATWGRAYTAAEYTGWLLDTGFTDVKMVPLRAAGANGVIVAVKP